MNSRKSNYLLYIIVVIIPIFIAFIYHMYDEFNRDFNQRKEKAIWIATIHQKSWDQFISETVTTLDILALTAETELDSIEKLYPLLKKAHGKDPRYGGIYLLDPEGKVITGSNSLLTNTNLSNQEYIKEITRTKDIVISNNLETLKNGQKVIGIGEPVLNDEGQLVSIIIAHLRIDYVQNIMRLLTPDTKLSVINQNGSVIMDINMNGSTKFSQKNSISLPFDRLPWSIKVEIPNRDMGKIIKTVSLVMVRFIFICHIMFLLIKYLMLRKQTAREKKENELQKLELVGTLAASTAHEIRNPLTGIKGLVQLLSEKYTNTDDQYYFSVINDEISRINEIVSEFLILGKPTAQKTEIIDTRKIIIDLEPLIISEANLNNVQYESSLPCSPIYVDCTKDQLKQVLLNITKNALESMPEGGKLSISLIELPYRCQIQVSDTGSGIPEGEIEKIFQPFYTSKDLGTGLGLVVCKRILQSFGGEIQIASKVNKGTIVDIFLPTKEK
ncbi:ATP-binding protein [Cytobacillus dafuensis]|uniref:histidine kinase n=1 Tax=Cytobacillus dafuensis TaxID=1742359 RepID=A0A5B8Z351_CYTDA|nr:ATP-binding protein [Cytobacillus dafuensis]QED47331.1 sensor histidine kinase [Cytobacillus dafuensis]